MQYQWILDVLSDLKVFAKSNGLAALAEQLDDTSLVAAGEISQITGSMAGGFPPDAGKVGALHRRAAASDNA